MNRKMYHTQERRATKLQGPKMSNRSDCWLGPGFYFWYYEEDAVIWGNESKDATGHYEIYQATIDCSHVLDTVFNEGQYSFWVRSIEFVAKDIFEKSGVNISLKNINKYLIEKVYASNCTGVLFQDLPANNRDRGIVRSVIPGLLYKKRIQLAVYKEKIISNFAFHKEAECS